MIAAGAVTLLSLATFRETYKVKILQGKANRIRKENDGDLSHSRHHYITNASFMRSMLRPMKMLLFSPIVLIISSYTAITYGVSYLILTTLTEVLEINYGFRQGSAGLAYLARGTDFVFSSYASICLAHTKARHGNDHSDNLVRYHVRSLPQI